MADSHQPEEARSLLVMTWRRRQIVIGLVLIGVLAGLALSMFGTAKESVTTRIFLSRTQPFEPFPQTAQQVDPVRYTASQVNLLTSTPVLEAASRSLTGRPSVKELQDNSAAQIATTADVITLTEKADSAITAAGRANAIVSAYRALVLNSVNQQAQAAAAVAPDAAAKAQILGQAQISGDGVSVVEPAVAADATQSQSHVTLALLGGLIGLLLGVAVALIAEGRRSSSRRRLDAGEVLGVPQLGEVSRILEQVPSGISSEGLHTASRTLATLEYASRRPFSGVLLVANAGPDSDGSAVVDLAVAAAADGRRVIVVDTRTPQTKYSGDADDHPCLVQLAHPEVALSSVARYWAPFSTMQVAIVPGRTPDSSGGWLGPSRSVERALLRLRNEADLVIIDAAPVSSDETFVLLGLADAGVIVVTPQTKTEDLQSASDAFDLAGRPVVGFIRSTSKSRAKHSPLRSPSGGSSGDKQPALTPPSKA